MSQFAIEGYFYLRLPVNYLTVGIFKTFTQFWLQKIY